jgi:hypothetical protein
LQQSAKFGTVINFTKGIAIKNEQFFGVSSSQANKLECCQIKNHDAVMEIGGQRFHFAGDLLVYRYQFSIFDTVPRIFI